MDTILAGRYHLLRPLGGGGFGQTFLATDRHLPGQPTCVVKQFQPRSTTRESLQIAKRLFDLEAEILYQLGSHDRIPRLLAHFEQNSEFYLVQEFIEGESLQQELAHRLVFSETEVIWMLRDILDVLAFVHRQQVIHRDIKPSNLIRRRSDRRLVLIDFGAVKQVSVQSEQAGYASLPISLTVAIGSPGYMPAEQLSSHPQFSSDIYAVGMLALQALSGTHPMDLPREPQSGEICCAGLGDRLCIHPALAALLDRMVRYDYRQRYIDATEALRALTALDSSTEAFSETTTLLAPLGQPLVESAQPIANSVCERETLPPAPVLIQRISSTVANSVTQKNSWRNSAATLSSQEYRNRQALLNKVKNYWVNGVLETSLHDQVLIVLGLEARPDAIGSPWNIALSTESQPPRTLPQGTQIISVFNQMGTGRTLLILGEPGAGKTTSLLQLARDLIAEAEQDVSQLIPVVLNLSSWAGKKQTIAAWVVEELNSKYQVPKKIAQPWVEHQQLLLLLDGLDEVQAEDREGCVAAINTFQQEYVTEMVVCSRIRDYESLSNRLNVQSAIYLRALSPQQIYYYLDSFDADLTGLKVLLQNDTSLQDLAQSPLMLNIMMLAYQDVAVRDLSEGHLIEQRRDQLFEAYVDRMFRRRGNGHYAKLQAIFWLSWLAQQMIQQSQTVFLIEQIQPTWLHNRSQQFIYRLQVVLTGALLGVPIGFSSGMLTNGLLEGWADGLFKSVVNSVIFGLIFAVVLGRSSSDITTVETLKWSWKEAQRNLRRGVIRGLPWGFLGGFLFGLMGELIPGLIPDLHRSRFLLGLTGGLTAALTGGVVAGLISGLRGSIIETKTIPNQGIWRSAFSAGISGFIGASTGLLTVGLIYGLMLGPNYGLIYGIGYGAVGGLIAGFIFGGGQAYIKHFLLRVILYCQGYMPWNYARFLDYCCNRVFLQKVGGGYIFIHRLLMEHFAQDHLK